ncbi:hypothetical protein DYB32_006086 [Aphanomyces invadans]|uniref:Peptidase S74 domain-containing protein n=1 Tax=Aphanomyces invadans TaxID=157072 RepID=A0A418AVE1_9STRA|nr:hypothetical protein DYB32_006086 [Aphanomyces invadans]
MLDAVMNLDCHPAAVEHEYCSRRGICDFTTGLCTCFLDYKTSDCSQLSNIPDNIDDHDGFLIQPIGPSYVGTALHIHTIKAMATDFQMIKIEAATQAIFYMLGNGDTFWTKGNVRVDSGTLFVQAGETIATGGLLVQDGGSTTTLSTVAGTVSDSLASNTGFTGTVMTVRATQPAAMSFYLFTASTANSNVAMFDIRGDGRTTVHSGGLEVVLGGATITDNAVATSVLTIQASNVAYTGTVVTVAATMASLFPATDFNLLTASAGGTTAVTVEASGKTTLANGGLYVNGIGGGNFVNQDPLAPALTALSGLGTFLGTVATLEATRAASTAFKLLEAKSNGVVTFSVRGDGFTTVHSGGFQVLLGGGTITAGGFFVNAGGATVNAGGLMVTSGGATVQAQGLVVVDGGADITSTAQLLPSLAVHASHVAFQDSVAVIETTVVAAASSFYLLKMRTSTTTTIFDVRGDGVTTIHQGGLVVTTGGVNVVDTGATITSAQAGSVVSDIVATNTTFTSTVLRVASASAAGTGFYLFKAASASTTPIFQIRGDGYTVLYQGGFLVNAGGLTITAGGLTVTDDGETITTTSTTLSASTLTASSTSYTGSVLKAVSATAAGSGFYLFSALSGTSTPIFDIRGDGLTTIAQGGLSITTGGATIAAGGLVVSTVGATISAGGLTVTAGGATVAAGGLTVTTVGATVSAGGLTVSDGGAALTTTSTTLSASTVTASSTSYTGTVLKAVSATAAGSGFFLFKALSGTSTSVFDIQGDGLTTIRQGGLSIVNGGATIAAGGLVVSTVGATISAGGLTVTNGGATVTAGGLVVSNGGASITQSTAAGTGLAVTASSTSRTGPVLTAATATVAGTGFYLFDTLVSSSTSVFSIRGDGLTTLSQGNLVLTTGDLTLTAGGLSAAGTVVLSNSATATTASTGALQVTGGIGVGGDIYCAGTAHVQVLDQYSDARLKQAIHDIAVTRAEFDALRPYEWKRRSKELGVQAGFIAQEVQLIWPHLVHADGDGTLSINYNGITPYVVARIQGLERDLDVAANEKEILQHEVDQLKQDAATARTKVEMLEREAERMKVEMADIQARMERWEARWDAAEAVAMIV